MIQILLASYNSEKFLAQQLESLFAQSCQEFEVIISDGGSQDGTLAIIADFQKRYPDRLRLVSTEPARACQNFARLLAAADSELMMFCDHDDVWKADKIAISLAAYKKLEAEYSPEVPLMVFTDSEIVDGELNPLLPSMTRSQKLNRSRFTPGRTIIQNYASGNTMLFNRALQQAALPIGERAVMHDHWVTLAAALFGAVSYVDVATIFYRQHGNNVLGAFRYDCKSCWKKLIAESGQFRQKLYRKLEQAQDLLEQHRATLTAEQSVLLDGLKKFKAMNKFARWLFLLRNDMLHEGLLRNIALFICC